MNEKTDGNIKSDGVFSNRRVSIIARPCVGRVLMDVWDKSLKNKYIIEINLKNALTFTQYFNYSRLWIKSFVSPVIFQKMFMN